MLWFWYLVCRVLPSAGSWFGCSVSLVCLWRLLFLCRRLYAARRLPLMVIVYHSLIALIVPNIAQTSLSLRSYSCSLRVATCYARVRRACYARVRSYSDTLTYSVGKKWGLSGLHTMITRIYIRTQITIQALQQNGITTILPLPNFRRILV